MVNQDYSVWQLFEMEVCIQCQVCVDICLVVIVFKEGKFLVLYCMKGL